MDVKRYYWDQTTIGEGPFDGPGYMSSSSTDPLHDRQVVDATDFDRVTAELAALQSRLNETDAENDRLRAGLKRLARHDCGCAPCRGECRTGRAAEIEFEERMQYAADLLENKHEQQ